MITIESDEPYEADGSDDTGLWMKFNTLPRFYYLF